MEKINLPYHLVIPSLISILILGIIILKRKRLFVNGKRKWFWISTTVFFVIYLLIVGMTTYVDLDCQWTVNKFDLDGNGIFTNEELTPEAEKAIGNLIHDTGRNLSFIFGIFQAGIISLFVFIAGKIFDYLKTKTVSKALNQKSIKE